MEWDKMLKILKAKRDRQHPEMIDQEVKGIPWKNA